MQHGYSELNYWDQIGQAEPRMVDRNGGEFGLPPQAQRESLELKTSTSHDFMTFHEDVLPLDGLFKVIGRLGATEAHIDMSK